MTERTRARLVAGITAVYLATMFAALVMGWPTGGPVIMTLTAGALGWLLLFAPTSRPPTPAELAEQRRRARLEEIWVQTIADRDRAAVLARTLALELENDIPPSDFAAELDELSARTEAFNVELSRLVQPGPRQTTKPPRPPTGKGGGSPKPPPPPTGKGGGSPKPPPPPQFRDPDEHVTIRVFGKPQCVCGTPDCPEAAPPFQPDFEIIDGGGCTCHRHVGRGIPDCPIHKFS